jgi:hypothetical protein
MPVDHDPTPAVADMPLCREVLVPGTEMFGILESEARAVVPSPQIAGLRARSVPLVTMAIACLSLSGVM